MQHDADSELIFERSIRRTAGMLAGCILLTGISYFCISRQIFDIAFAGWLFGLIVGPAGILANGVALFRGGPHVVFDEIGIHDCRTFGFLPWTDIRCIQVGSFYSDRFLCLYLADESARWAGLSTLGRLALRLNHVKGCPRFTVRFKGLTRGIQEAWNYLEVRHPDKIVAVVPDATLSHVNS